MKKIKEDELELREDLVRDIDDSRKRKVNEFVFHEDMRKEFG